MVISTSQSRRSESSESQSCSTSEATPPHHPCFIDLPDAILQRIIAFSLQEELLSNGQQSQERLITTFMYELGDSRLNQLTTAVVWSSLILPDDDLYLIQAENYSHAAAEYDHPNQCKDIKSMSQFYIDPNSVFKLIHHLTVQRRDPVTASIVRGVTTDPAGPPCWPQSSSPVAEFSSNRIISSPEPSATLQLGTAFDVRPNLTEDPTAYSMQPLEDQSFLRLVSELISLRSFTWRAGRHPPRMLCAALGATTKVLTSFKLELCEHLEESSQVVHSPNSPVAALASPGRRLSPSTSTHAAGTTTLTSGRICRWDAPDLSKLPLSLTHLSLSHLSQTGARELAEALPSLPLIDHLELGKSVYIDDALLAEVGKHAPKLVCLRLFNLPGSKLTDVGLGDVFDGCTSLEVLQLHCVEGRFSKTTWSKLSPLPESLRKLELIYHEHPQPAHKSWVLDHLNSLAMALEFSSIQSLTISRQVEDVARAPGQHWVSQHPIDPVLAPKSIPNEFVQAIAIRGAKWKTLNLDLWYMGSNALKHLLSTCTSLESLQILLNEPFKNLLVLSNTFAVAHHLRHFIISIEPDHAPELADVVPSNPSRSPTTSPMRVGSLTSADPSTSNLATKPSQPRRASVSSTHSKTETPTSAAELLSSIGPTIKDWRRFLRKTLVLQSVEWTGRGGVGTWSFERAGSSSSNTRVDFEPSYHYLQASGRTPERSWDSSLDLVALESPPIELRTTPRRIAIVPPRTPAQPLDADSPQLLSEAFENGLQLDGMTSRTTSPTTILRANYADVANPRRSLTPPIGTWSSRTHLEQQQQGHSQPHSTPKAFTPTPTGLVIGVTSLTPFTQDIASSSSSIDVSNISPQLTRDSKDQAPPVRRGTLSPNPTNSTASMNESQPHSIRNQVDQSNENKSPSSPRAPLGQAATSNVSTPTRKTWSGIVGGEGPTKVVPHASRIMQVARGGGASPQAQTGVNRGGVGSARGGGNMAGAGGRGSSGGGRK